MKGYIVGTLDGNACFFQSITQVEDYVSSGRIDDDFDDPTEVEIYSAELLEHYKIEKCNKFRLVEDFEI